MPFNNTNSSNSSFFERDHRFSIEEFNQNDFHDTFNSSRRKSYVDNKRSTNKLYSQLNGASKQQNSPPPEIEDNLPEGNFKISNKTKKVLNYSPRADKLKGIYPRVKYLERIEPPSTISTASLPSSRNEAMPKYQNFETKHKPFDHSATVRKKDSRKLVTITEIPKIKEPTREQMAKINNVVVLRNKLSKRAKIKLKLESIIRQLKDPATFINTSKEYEKPDEALLSRMLKYANRLSTAMNYKKKSLDTLF